MFNDPFKDIKGKRVDQVAVLLGPTGGGKTELMEAVKSLKKAGERKLSRFALPTINNDSKLAIEFKKLEAKVSYLDDRDRTVDIQPISRWITLFRASLRFVDGPGLEDAQLQTIRVSDFLEKHILPKPRKWKGGVFAIMVFNIKDILTRDAKNCATIEASYRDVLEFWGEMIYPDLEEEAFRTEEEKMRNPKKRIPKKTIRPPLAVIFVASHMDELPSEISGKDARNEVTDFVRGIERKALSILPLPTNMPKIDSRCVCADLKSLRGRIDFAKSFYKARKDLTERMQEQMQAQK